MDRPDFSYGNLPTAVPFNHEGACLGNPDNIPEPRARETIALLQRDNLRWRRVAADMKEGYMNLEKVVSEQQRELRHKEQADERWSRWTFVAIGVIFLLGMIAGHMF